MTDRINGEMLQQGLDAMTAGICFINENGETVLINKTMKNIADAAFGSELCLKNVTAAEPRDGCGIEADKDKVWLVLADKSVWDIKSREIAAGGEVYTECTAFDVTELYGKNRELKKRNAHLSAVNEKVREYSKSLDAVIREKELLDAKIKIHDDVGRALLSLRSYLNREDKDRDSLVKLWRFTVSVLRRETAADRSDDRMETLAEAARAVDVALHYDGVIPNDPVIKEISVTAVRECLTNTVKHAGGNNVYIRTSSEDGVFVIKIKNDGKKPEKPVEETGGLYSLRKSVERYGGNMTVLWENGFELTVTLGFGEDGK